MLTLRPYQQEALDAIKTAFREQTNVLLQAATGAGKTILFSALIRDFMTQYPGVVRIMIAVHRQNLVQQAYDKLLRVWPEGESQIGIACHSLTSKSDFTKPVVIGTVQTIARQLDKMEFSSCNLLIIDEVHMLRPKAKTEKEVSQYEKLINRLRTFDPRARLLGVTATPYRLEWGYIYGDVKTQDPSRNWFPNLTYSIDITTLQAQGFLCPLDHWGEGYKLDLSSVATGSNGDYKENALSEEMSKSIHLESAVNAVRTYASDRKHIVVFGVTIEHARLLAKAFNRGGYKAVAVHSDCKQHMNTKRLELFENGSVNVLVNVGKLTEGWDCPQTDCVVLCRPTKSAALYVQMVGRGLRIAEGKDKCLMLDLAGCLAEHGFPEAPEIKNKLPDKTNWLECPECGKENLVDATECTKCGYLFAFVRCPQCGVENKVDAEKCKACGWVLPKAPVPVAEEEEEKEESQYACPYCGAMVKPTAIRCWKCHSPLQLISGNVTLQKIELDAHRLGRQRAKLVGTPNINFHFRSKKGNTMMRVTLACLIGDDDLPTPVSDYLDIEGNGSEYGKARARTKWHQLTGRPYVPSTLDAAESMRADLRFPEYVTVELKNGQYWNVASY